MLHSTFIPSFAYVLIIYLSDFSLDNFACLGIAIEVFNFRHIRFANILSEYLTCFSISVRQSLISKETTYKVFIYLLGRCLSTQSRRQPTPHRTSHSPCKSLRGCTTSQRAAGRTTYRSRQSISYKPVSSTHRSTAKRTLHHSTYTFLPATDCARNGMLNATTYNILGSIMRQ